MFVVNAKFALNAAWYATHMALCAIAGPSDDSYRDGTQRVLAWQADSDGSARVLAASLRGVPGVMLEVIPVKLYAAGASR